MDRECTFPKFENSHSAAIKVMSGVRRINLLAQQKGNKMDAVIERFLERPQRIIDIGRMCI